jgi:hypothetical protein
VDDEVSGHAALVGIEEAAKLRRAMPTLHLADQVSGLWRPGPRTNRLCGGERNRAYAAGAFWARGQMPHCPVQLINLVGLRIKVKLVDGTFLAIFAWFWLNTTAFEGCQAP